MAAFAPGMSLGQIDQEVRTAMLRGASLNSIASEARGAGVRPAFMIYSMTGNGAGACSAVTALVAAGYDANEVINGAKAVGAQGSMMVQCAIEGGADPTQITEASAAGGGTGGGTGIGGGPTSFGATPTGTFGGGGGGSVSRS